MLIVDLSNHNPPADFARLRKAGIAGVWLKASEGRTFRDATFASRRDAARRAGLRVGAYHFARPDTGNSAEAEAAHFCSVVRSLGRRDLRPVLDLEHGRASGAYVAWARAWNASVRENLGALPLFYSYPSYIVGLRAVKPIGAGLWLASYGRNDGREHDFSIPLPWRKIVAHQFTSQARVAGIAGPVDLSRVYQRRAVLAYPWLGLL